MRVNNQLPLLAIGAHIEIWKPGGNTMHLDADAGFAVQGYASATVVYGVGLKPASHRDSIITVLLPTRLAPSNWYF